MILFGVRGAGGGAVDDFGAQAKPEGLGLGQEFFGVSGDGHPEALEGVQGQAAAGLAVAAGACVDGPQVVKGEEGLHLADGLAAGASGIERLGAEATEGAAHGEDALAAVGTVVGLGQQSGREQATEEVFEVEEALLADVLDAAAEGGEAGAEGGEKGGGGGV